MKDTGLEQDVFRDLEGGPPGWGTDVKTVSSSPWKAWGWKENILEMGTLERYTVERSNTGDGVLSTLTINNVMEVDFQTRYNCTAWNAFGPQTAIIQLEEKGGQSEGAAASAREGLSPAFHLEQLPLCPREGQEWGGSGGCAKSVVLFPCRSQIMSCPLMLLLGLKTAVDLDLARWFLLGFPLTGLGLPLFTCSAPPHFPQGDGTALTQT